jgi:hypothetical protein
MKITKKYQNLPLLVDLLEYSVFAQVFELEYGNLFLIVCVHHGRGWYNLYITLAEYQSSSISAISV